MLKNEQIINEVNEEELIQKEAEFEDYVVEKNKQIKSGEKDVEKSKSELETLRNEVTELQKSAADEMKNAQNILAIAEAEKRKNVTAQEEIETQKKELEKEAQQLDEREKSIEQIINSRVKKEKELIVNEANVIISQKCDEWVKQVLNNASELNFYARFGADKQYVKQAADNLKIPTVTEKDVGPELG
jgi:chromosome segregation ATPase